MLDAITFVKCNNNNKPLEFSNGLLLFLLLDLLMLKYSKGPKAPLSSQHNPNKNPRINSILCMGRLTSITQLSMKDHQHLLKVELPNALMVYEMMVENFI